MTSALRGEGVTQYVTNTTDRLRECMTKGGEGVQNPENFADVIAPWVNATSHLGRVIAMSDRLDPDREMSACL